MKVINSKTPYLNKKLLTLWEKLTREQQERFSTLVEKSRGSMRHVAEGRRGISSGLAIKIEKASETMKLTPPLSRMGLNETCRRCEYARRCTKGEVL